MEKKIQRKKVSIIGAGNIGGILAEMIAKENAADILLFDLKEDIAKGKALDIAQSAAVMGFDLNISGTSDYSELSGSDGVIVTAGVPRKPGMTRDDLVSTNAEVIKGVAQNIKTHIKSAFVIVITNPLDSMVWVMHKVLDFGKNKVVGMAGILDSSRMNHFLSMETGISVKNISTMVLGGHGDEMVPLARHSFIGGLSLVEAVKAELLTQEKVDSIILRTQKGGGEIVNLLGRSAHVAPAASAYMMLDAFLHDRKSVLPCSAFLEGEYGFHDIFAGVPCVIGGGGVEKIIEFPLTSDEQDMFLKSVKSVKVVLELLKKDYQK